MNDMNDPDRDDFDFDDTPAPVRLSAAGERRRVEMLRDLEGAVVSRRRRRKAVRVGAAAAAAALVVIASVALFRRETERLPATSGGGVSRTEDPAPPFVEVLFEEVRTDPSLLALVSVPTDPTIAQRARIDDGVLLDLLAASGRPTGLIRFGGQVVLTGLETDDTAERSPIAWPPESESRGM